MAAEIYCYVARPFSAMLLTSKEDFPGVRDRYGSAVVAKVAVLTCGTVLYRV